MESKKAIYRDEYDIEFTHVDLNNKIYHENHTRDIYLFGIRIFHKNYHRTEKIEDEENSQKIGFGN